MNRFRTVALDITKLPLNRITLEGFKGLLFHISPKASIGFSSIYSKGRELAPASFFAPQGATELEVESKVLARQSYERVKLMFENDYVTASLTEEEMEEFQRLLDSENFIAHAVTFVYEDDVYDYFYQMPRDIQEIFEPYLELFSLQTVLDDVGNEDEAFKKLRQEIYERAYNDYVKQQTEPKKDIGGDIAKSYIERKKKELDESQVLIAKQGFMWTVISIVLAIIEKVLSRHSFIGSLISLAFKGFSKLAGAIAVANVSRTTKILTKRAGRFA